MTALLSIAALLALVIGTAWAAWHQGLKRGEAQKHDAEEQEKKAARGETMQDVAGPRRRFRDARLRGKDDPRQ